MGYHKAKIKKGVVGEVSKIQEEIDELKDALSQNNRVMALVELSDMCGAISAFLDKHFQSISMQDLLTMAAATKSAFEDGSRQ